MIRAVIFDMGGVMVKNKSEAVFSRLAEKLGVDPASLDDLRKENYREMLIGEKSSRQFAEMISRRFNLSADVIGEWKKSYLEVMPVNEDLAEMTGSLKRIYKVAIISNVPDLHADINKKRGVFSHFEPALISCDVGMAKPDRGIFELALEKLDMKAEECIFIDDREKFLKTPEEMGFRTIHFRSNGQLKKDLVKLGVQI